MESLIHALAGLLMHANPVNAEASLSHNQFIGIAQLGLVLILVGMALIGMVRSGIPEGPSLIIVCAIVLMAASYLFAHGSNPFDLAEKASIIAGGIFRFIGGVGVALGAACLLGIKQHSLHGNRDDLLNPVVIATSATYALFLVSPDGSGLQIWTVLSITAPWISFAGLHSILRSRLGFSSGQRQLAVVAGGVMLLVLMSFITTPGYLASKLTYAGCFPAGVVLGIFRQLAV